MQSHEAVVATALTTRTHRQVDDGHGACRAKRGEIVSLGGLWLEGHGLPVASEVLGLSSRVRRAAASLRTLPDELLVASRGLAKTATLTILRCG
tara:strand:+ start:842 stop:1123 length:282 start_codon:yes stop_codon:yes gene_type:complete